MGVFRHSHCMGVFHVCSWFCNMMLFSLVCQLSRLFLLFCSVPSNINKLLCLVLSGSTLFLLRQNRSSEKEIQYIFGNYEL